MPVKQISKPVAAIETGGVEPISCIFFWVGLPSRSFIPGHLALSDLLQVLGNLLPADAPCKPIAMNAVMADMVDQIEQGADSTSSHAVERSAAAGQEIIVRI